MFQVVDVLFLLVTPANPPADPRGHLLNTVQYSTVHRLVLPRQRAPSISRDGHAHDREDYDPGHHDEGLHPVQLKSKKLPGAGETAPQPWCSGRPCRRAPAEYNTKLRCTEMFIYQYFCMQNITLLERVIRRL